MTIEQTVEVPPSRRITLDLPPNLTGNKVRVIVFPVVEKSKTEIALLSMRGSCKGLDTMEAYFARKHADKELENRKAGIV